LFRLLVLGLVLLLPCGTAATVSVSAVILLLLLFAAAVVLFDAVVPAVPLVSIVVVAPPNTNMHVQTGIESFETNNHLS